MTEAQHNAMEKVRIAAGDVAELEMQLEAAKEQLEKAKTTARKYFITILTPNEMELAKTNKILAIQALRARTPGLSLHEAKEIVDFYLGV